ncbi:3-oxoacyl-[acyl-carrier-protein] synthase III C-terminal domain-containing protein [Cytophagales bacterium LB-30]|uniref:3-oxoacyl-[acyl-carrier-protein] synthase III C-terminal domain-containing protein n=2 Tax=Shiella aurantiaca TaxID=3058365 RepID=A0ABT8F3W1_9BACT|nr:3-oxoacyl-[acyl-carrier-protein] synthase III C-terminal domain-containing protein [Shiella aurantiaca]
MGKALPKMEVLSTELEKELGLPAGYIEKYSGVRKRYRAEDESNSSLGAAALHQALQHAKISAKELGYLISASATFDYPLPNRASAIKKQMEDGEKTHFPCLDIDTTCLSFVSALDIAAGFLHPVHCKYVAIVSSEIASKGLNPKDVETYTLFGDAAVACIIGVTEKPEQGLIHYQLQTYSEGAELTMIKGGGNRYHPKEHPYQTDLYSFFMQGRQLLKLAKRSLPSFMEQFWKDSTCSLHEVDAIIPHQASKAGLILLQDITQGHKPTIGSNLAAYGNCIAASIPLLLMEMREQGNVQEGSTVLLIGTAAGFSIGAALIRL